MNPDVAVLDYGSGNIRSVARALQAAGADVTVTSQAGEARQAAGLVVPGVGAFAACMRSLQSVGGPDVIDARLAGGRAVLGICVGMQVLFESGDEHGLITAGCAQWPGEVTRLAAPILPHMGWNTVAPARDSRLFEGLADQRFYFLHSFAAKHIPMPASGTDALRAPQLTWAEYGEPFLAAVENGPLSATQFHPEKSGDAGVALLRNWLATL